MLRRERERERARVRESDRGTEKNYWQKLAARKGCQSTSVVATNLQNTENP